MDQAILIREVIMERAWGPSLRPRPLITEMKNP
jgi:hypothetical protein